MKKYLLVLLFFVGLTSETIGQKETTSNKNIYTAKEIVFYGYDYTHFKLADPKRIGQNIKNFIFRWNVYCNDRVNEKTLSKWLKKNKVIINQDPTINLNKRLNSDNLGSKKKNILSKDSIQNCINNYSISEKEGLGFVIIYECYDNYSETVSAYYTFFDIATKIVLHCDYFASKDSKSYNRVKDWGAATVIAIKKYVKIYQKNLDTNKKY